MSASRALRRLLRVRIIEEELARIALESATGELAQLERAFAATRVREHGGRQLFHISAQTGDLSDRLAGLEEADAARRRFDILTPRIAEAGSKVEELRQEFLAKRVECRQAETLIEEAEARDAIIAARRMQQGLDDWYLHKPHPKQHRPSLPEPIPSPLSSVSDVDES